MKYLSLLLTCLPFFLQAENTMHVLLMRETEDAHLAPSTYHDVRRMKTSLETIAGAMHYTINVKTLEGSAVTPHNVKKWFHSIPCSLSDIVVCYYSGHGAKDKKYPQWPVLTPLSGESNAIAGRAIVDFMENHCHKLGIVLFDCCNKGGKKKYCSRIRRGEENDPILMPSMELSGLIPLFARGKGCIAAAASQPKEYADWIDEPLSGGYFTLAFLYALQEHAASPFTSWNALLDKSQQTCTFLNNEQHPIYEVKDYIPRCPLHSSRLTKHKEATQ